MTATELLVLLRECPIVASVQASEGSPLEDPGTLLRLAQASIGCGVRLLRLQGVPNILAIKGATGLPVIGLVKRSYPICEVYITPTQREIDELVTAGCEIIALDATARPRPGGADLRSLIARVHEAGRLAMADCDSVDTMRRATELGADIVGTTLAGYTGGVAAQKGPFLDLVREAASQLSAPVLAEGMYSQPWQAEAALRAGAAGVVIGGALNDPVKQTQAFVSRASSSGGPVGAVDIGGTWLRFGQFSPDWKLLSQERVALPSTHADRMDWIRSQLRDVRVTRLGISAGGTIDPSDGTVIESKTLIPDHAGHRLHVTGTTGFALNDGLATAWGHACLPEYAGMRVATLALGTGVGCGFVAEQRIWMGRRGEYVRLNDLPCADGRSFEEMLGGAALTASPSAEQKKLAVDAARAAVEIVDGMLLPDRIVVCGGVGLSDWLDVGALGDRVVRSPFGLDAGLYGAAALALWPPDLARV